MERAIETLYDEDYDRLIFRRPDGSTIRMISLNAIAPSSGPRQIGETFKYNYNSNTSPPPSNNQMRTNSNVAADVTQIFVANIEDDGRDVNHVLMLAKQYDKMYIQDFNDSSSYGDYILTADAVNSDGYVTFNVTYDMGSGNPVNGNAVLVGFVRK